MSGERMTGASRQSLRFDHGFVVDLVRSNHGVGLGAGDAGRRWQAVLVDRESDAWCRPPRLLSEEAVEGGLEFERQKTPRLRLRLVRVAKKPSTALSQGA